MKNNFTKLGLGTSTIASLGKSLSYVHAKKLFDIALDYNIRTIDTSDTYGSGDAEKLIGKIVKDKRNNFFIISKVGYRYLSLPNFFFPLNQIGKKILQNFKSKKCFKKEYILSGIEKSLKRLKIENLDCFLLHDPILFDLSTNNQESCEALYLIKKKGLSEFVGISTNDEESIYHTINNIKLDLIQTRMIYKKDNLNILNNIKKNNYKLIVNSLFNKEINQDFNIKIDQLLKNFNISKEDKKSVLIAYCITQKKIDCALFRTHNIDHLKQIALGFNKYKKNYNNIFSIIDEIINDN